MSDVATDPKSAMGIGKYDSPYAIGILDGVEIRCADFRRLPNKCYSQSTITMNGQEIFLRANNLLRRLLDANKPNLDLKSIDAVLHYLDHDEYEMAFEGLFIDLMTLG